MNLMKYSIIVLEMLVGYVKILNYIVAYMVFKLFIYRSKLHSNNRPFLRYLKWMVV